MPFLSCFEPRYESKASCKAFYTKIRFVCTVNSLYCGHSGDGELVSFIARDCNSRYLFQSKSVVYFCQGLAVIHIIGVSKRRELIVYE